MKLNVQYTVHVYSIVKKNITVKHVSEIASERTNGSTIVILHVRRTFVKKGTDGRRFFDTRNYFATLFPFRKSQFE